MNLQHLLALFFGLLLCFPGVVAGPKLKTLKPVKINGKWGYAGKNGKLVIPAQFDRALEFNGTLARVGVRNPVVADERDEEAFLWGFVDATGRVVVKLEYSQLRDFSEGMAAVAQLASDKTSIADRMREYDLRWGFVDRSGTVVIPLQYDSVGDFSEGLAAISTGREKDRLCPRRGKFGYIDKSGAVVIRPEYGAAAAFRGGRARVGLGEVEYVGRCLCCNPEFRGEWGYIDRNGKFTADK